MGHEDGLTEVYRRYSFNQLREFYQKGEHTLSVFSIGQDMRKFWNDIDVKNQQLQQRVTGLTYENMTLKTELQTMNDRLQVLERNNTLMNEDVAKRNSDLFSQFMDFMNQHYDPSDSSPSIQKSFFTRENKARL
jgi:predicted nuclease with TOPRIM domain